MLKNNYKYIITIIIFISFSCDLKKYDPELRTTTFLQANQQFSIVSFYLNMPVYIKKAKENKKQINKIYKTYVYDPIWDNFASKGECSFLAKNIKYPITEIDGLDTAIKILSDSGVEDIIKKALLKVSKVLPGPNTTIYIQILNPSYKKMIPSNASKIIDMGMHADTYGTGRILIAIDPMSKNWKKMLPRIVAHEYHHSVWVSRNFETINFSLLDCLILEGRAEGFADLIYPDIEAPWPGSFDLNYEYRVWQHMKQVLHSKDEQIITKMFAGNEEIPFLGVYSMGYKIMQEFFKNNPEVSLIEWTDMEPAEFLSKSKYSEKFN